MSSARRDLWLALSFGALLIVLAIALPHVLDWDVHLKTKDRPGLSPPLHSEWEPRLGPGTVPALLLAAVGLTWSFRWADRLSWRWLLVASFVGAVSWSTSLALVDGWDGFDVLGIPSEYLRSARAVDDVPALLRGYVDRIPFDSADRWPVHLAGHPPGAVLFFVLLDRLGLGGDVEAGLVVTAIAATTPAAVLVTLRALGAETPARRVAPFLVLGPAALWQAVSADAMFGAVAAWGLAALALAAVRRSTPLALLGGLLLGCCVMMSYGLLVLGVLALAVLWVSQSWRPLLPAVVAASAVVGTFAVCGFNYLEALPVLRERYWAGIASDRPTSYWLWANLACLLLSAGPLAAVGLPLLRARAVAVARLGAAAWVTVLLADATLMSKAEVERIWLPFVPWLLLPLALLPGRWQRPGLALQVVVALVLQHLLNTVW